MSNRYVKSMTQQKKDQEMAKLRTQSKADQHFWQSLNADKDDYAANGKEKRWNTFVDPNASQQNIEEHTQKLRRKYLGNQYLEQSKSRSNSKASRNGPSSI